MAAPARSVPAFHQGETEVIGDRPVRVLFVGRGVGPGRSADAGADADAEDDERGRALRRLVPPGTTTSWLDQVHGADVLEATGGLAGRGDALTTAGGDHAVAVVTADCVPVLLADPQRVAAVHAGWRGIVAGVVAATLERLEPRRTVAWIGPAIGAACYEVSDQVADRIASASGPEVLRPGTRGLPHVDLVAAVRRQLEAAGVRDVRSLDCCTHTERDRFYSYRRDGAGTGRNWSVIWRPSAVSRDRSSARDRLTG